MRGYFARLGRRAARLFRYVPLDAEEEYRRHASWRKSATGNPNNLEIVTAAHAREDIFMSAMKLRAALRKEEDRNYPEGKLHEIAAAIVEYDKTVARCRPALDLIRRQED